MGCRSASVFDTITYPGSPITGKTLLNRLACTGCKVPVGWSAAYQAEIEADATAGDPDGVPYAQATEFAGTLPVDAYHAGCAASERRYCAAIAIPMETDFAYGNTTTDAPPRTIYYCQSCTVSSTYPGAPLGYWDVTWTCTACKGCEGGDEFWPSWTPAEDYFNGYCCPDCDAGECWCEETGECVSCDEEIENVDCEEDSNVEWDPFACEVTYDEPTCPPGESYDWENCECSVDGGGTRTTAGANPWHDTHPSMSYVGLAFERSRRIRFKRTEASVLPFETDNYITADPGAGSYKDLTPSFDFVRDIGRVVVAFYRNGGATPGVYTAYSDDDGATWTVDGTRTMQGSHPIIRTHPVLGTQVLIAYRSSKLYGAIKEPSDTTFGTEFTLTDSAGVDIAADDDGAALTPASDTSMRWYLTVRQSSTLKTYQSWDDCRTWTEVV